MTFQKGQSGNPTGRPKEIGVLIDMARSMVPDILLTLKKMSTDESEKGSVRLKAMELILQRSGMPTSPSLDDGRTIDGKVMRDGIIPAGRLQLEEFLKLQYQLMKDKDKEDKDERE